MATMRERSKQEWTSNKTIEISEINAGSFQRIADACELMAKNHAQLIADRDLYLRWYNLEREKVSRRDHQIAGLRGYIKRLKGKA